jgi:hypothetical protein
MNLTYSKFKEIRDYASPWMLTTQYTVSDYEIDLVRSDETSFREYVYNHLAECIGQAVIKKTPIETIQSPEFTSRTFRAVTYSMNMEELKRFIEYVYDKGHEEGMKAQHVDN